MPIWTGLSTRAALPRPLGTQAVTRAAFLEWMDDIDLKAAFQGVVNSFTANQVVAPVWNNAATTFPPALLVNPSTGQAAAATLLADFQVNGASRASVRQDGRLTIAGDLRMTAAASKIVPGATSFAVRDSADLNNNLGVTDAGGVTVRNGLTVAAGNLVVTAGSATFGGALSAVDSAIIAGAGANNPFLRLAGGAGSTQSYVNHRTGGTDKWSVGMTDGGDDYTWTWNGAAPGVKARLTNTGVLTLAGGDINVSGNLNIDQYIVFGHATGRIKPAAGGTVAVRDSADGQNNLLVRNNGTVDVFSTLTVLGGGMAVTGNATVASGTVIATPVGDDGFEIRKAAGNNRHLSFTTSGSQRWKIGASSTAEGGSNAGSNFELHAYSDTGVHLGAALSVARSTRVVTVETGLAVVSGTVSFPASSLSGAAISSAGTTGTGNLVRASGATLASPVLTNPEINNPTASAQYLIVPAAILADRQIALPLLTASDTFAVTDFAQTFKNKTLETPVIAALGWGNANHAHTASNSGGTLDSSAITGSITGTGNLVKANNPVLTTPGITDFTAAQHNHSNAAQGGSISVETSLQLTTPEIHDLGAEFQYIFSPSNLSADRAMLLPPLAADDEFVFRLHPQTLVGKTLTSPTINSPTITAPVIAGNGWGNANHGHLDAGSGGALSGNAITSVITGSGNVVKATNPTVTTLVVSAGGLDVAGSPSGFNGGEVRLGGTGAGLASAVSTQAGGSPSMHFDHRGTSNSGNWFWRNGTNAGTERMNLSAAGQLTVSSGINVSASGIDSTGRMLVRGTTLSQAFTVNGSTGPVDLFNINASTKLVDVLNGASFRVQSGNYVTNIFEVVNATNYATGIHIQPDTSGGVSGAWKTAHISVISTDAHANLQFNAKGAEGQIFFTSQHTVYNGGSLPRFSVMRMGEPVNRRRYDIMNNFGDLVMRTAEDGGDANARTFLAVARSNTVGSYTDVLSLTLIAPTINLNGGVVFNPAGVNPEVHQGNFHVRTAAATAPSSSGYISFRSRGSITSPTVISDLDVVRADRAYGYTGTVWSEMFGINVERFGTIEAGLHIKSRVRFFINYGGGLGQETLILQPNGADFFGNVTAARFYASQFMFNSPELGNDTGIYSVNDGTLGMMANNSLVARVASSGISLELDSHAFYAKPSSTSGFRFAETGNDTGMMWGSDGVIQFNCNGATKLQLSNSTGINTYWSGRSGAASIIIQDSEFIEYRVPTGKSHGFYVGGTERIHLSASVMGSTVDGGMSLGDSDSRYSTVWAVNGTIQTSLRQYKENYRPASHDDVMSALLGAEIQWANYKGQRYSQLVFVAEDSPRMCLEPFPGDGWNGSVSAMHTANMAVVGIQHLHGMVSAAESRMTVFEDELGALRGRVSVLEREKAAQAVEIATLRRRLN